MKSKIFLVLEKNGLLDYFKDDGKYTLFIPTNEAIKKLDQPIRESIINGEACVLDLLLNHILEKDLCACALNGYKLNKKGNILKFGSKRHNDTITINDEVDIIETNILATNGIVHVINNIISPQSIMPAKQVLEQDEEISTFYNLAKDSNMLSEINALKNVTVFVPTNEAFEHFELTKGDVESAKKNLIANHVLKGVIKPCSVENDVMLEAESGQKFRFNHNNFLHKSHYSLNCARFIPDDKVEACGSVMYKIDRVLVPPTLNMLDKIKSRPEFEIFSKILIGTKAEELLRDSDQSLTVLAMSNEVIDKVISYEKMQKLLEDKQYADYWLGSLILKSKYYQFPI